MIYNDYVLDNKYDLGGLDNTVYFYPFATTKQSCQFDTDSTGNGVVTKIQGDASTVWCESVSFSASATTDGRYFFAKDLSLTLLETSGETNYSVIEELISNDWMVGFKTATGDSFILNSEFPVKIEYSYGFADDGNGNVCTITVTANENTPIWLLNGSFSASTALRGQSTCGLNKGCPVKFSLISTADATVNDTGDNFTIYTGDKSNVKKVEWLSGTFTYTDALDDDVYSQQIQFSIPFKNMQWYFHYNLIEFLNNRYYAVIETSNGNTLLAGNRFGLIPSYSMSSSEDNGTPNMITITLTVGWTNFNSLQGAKEVQANYAHIRTYNNYEVVDSQCIGGYNVVTLIQEYSTTEPTGRYYCLEGFENTYKAYTIYGTYDKNSTDYGIRISTESSECDSSKCTVSGLPSVIILKKNYGAGNGYYGRIEVKTDCDILEATHPNSAVTITKTESGDTIIFDILDKRKAGDIDEENVEDNTITFTTEDDEYYVIITRNGNNTYYYYTHITAQAQTVFVPFGFLNYDEIIYNNISGVTTLGWTYELADDKTGYNLYVTENTSTSKQVTKTISFADATRNTSVSDWSKRIFNYITQDFIHTKTEDVGEMCNGVDLYKRVANYSGYTDETLTLIGYTQGDLVESGSSLCNGEYSGSTSGETSGSTSLPQYKWVENSGITQCLMSGATYNCTKQEIYGQDASGNTIYSNYISYLCDDNWVLEGYETKTDDG